MTRDELRESIRCSLFDEQDTDDIMAAVDAYTSSSNDGNANVMRSLPPLIEIEQALNLAQAELRSMYKRAGFKGSDVLSLVDAVWTKVKAAMPS